MSLFTKISGWAIALLCFYLGTSAFSITPNIGLVIIISAFFFVPPVREITYKLTNSKISALSRTGLIFVILIMALYSLDETMKAVQIEKAKIAAIAKNKELDRNAEYFKENKKDVLENIASQLKNKKYAELRLEFNNYTKVDDIEFNSIKVRYQSEIDQIQKENKTRVILETLKKVPSSEFEENKVLYQQLVEMHPKSKRYLVKFNHYNSKYNAQQEEINKQKMIEDLFWADGSFYPLNKLIKESLNNPDSFVHVRTKAARRGDYLVIFVTYRARNGFNAVITNEVSALISISGDIIKIY